MKVVVSGASGLIGRALVQHLTAGVEGIGGISTVRAGVRQQGHDRQHLHEAARPAVQQHDGHRIRTVSRLANEVHAVAIDARHVVLVAVEALLSRTPVVGTRPVVAPLAEVGEVGTVGPVPASDVVGPPRPNETLSQIGDHLVGDVDGERFDVHGRPPVSWPHRDSHLGAPADAASVPAWRGTELHPIAAVPANHPASIRSDDPVAGDREPHH